MSLKVGDQVTIAGVTYTLEESLGSGSYAEAFRARYTHIMTFLGKSIEREVVLKIPNDHGQNSFEHIRRLQREGRIQANVEHPNIVCTQGVFETEGASPYLVLMQDLVPGARNICEYVAADPEQAACVLLQTLYALRALHSTDAVHRDVSPSNVLVSGTGQVKLIDFGLALDSTRKTGVLTRSGSVFGTPGCAAPELHTAAATADGRADLYAVGKILAAGLQNVSPEHAQPHKLPQPWNLLLTKATELRREDRFGSADEMINASLEAFTVHPLLIHELEHHKKEHRKAPTESWFAWCRQWTLSNSDPEEAIVILRFFDSVPFLDFAASQHLYGVLEPYLEALRPPPYDDDVDFVGDRYLEMQVFFANQWKASCFERIVKLALRFHRYYLMGLVRKFYNQAHPLLQPQLLALLNSLDPGKVIHGHGVIPGR